MSIQSIPRPTPFIQDSQLLSIPPELILEIVSCVVEPTSKNGQTPSFSSRMKTLTNLSLTTPSLRSLILSSPIFWSKVEISIIHDVSCSPPLSFLRELFERSGQVKMSVQIVHWGEERQNYNTDKGWEWIPGATREVRRMLERHEHRIERLQFDFHALNGTEYVSRGNCVLGNWGALKHVEMYAANWAIVHSMPMDWVQSVLATASPETVVVKGNDPFTWSTLGRGMDRLRSIRVETEITENLVLDIISRAPGLEDCRFDQIIHVSSRPLGSSQSSRDGDHSAGGIVLPILKKLRIGSPLGGLSPFLNSITTPRLLELEIDFIENRRARWDQEVFVSFIGRSGLGRRLRKLVLRKGGMSNANLESCRAMVLPMTAVKVIE